MTINNVNLTNSFAASANQNRGVISHLNFTSKTAQNDDNQKASLKKIVYGGLLLGITGIAAFLVKKHIDFVKIYNDIWKDVTKGIDTSKIQIKKPKFIYTFSKKGKSIGGYNEAYNLIGINLRYFLENKYLVYKSADGHLVLNNIRPVHSLKSIEELKKKGVIDNSCIIKKLNFKERKLLISRTIAHEQRHCLQFHFILNDADYGADFLLNDYAKRHSKSLEAAKNANPYLTRFKSKTENHNLLLETDIIPGNNKLCLSTKDLARNISEYGGEGKETYENYVLNSLEIDANAFASSYLKNHPEIQQNCDENISKIFDTTSDVFSKGFLNKNTNRIQ